MVDFSSVSLPFNVGELLKAAMDLIMIIGPFLLLGLALMFSKEIMYFIRTLMIREQYRKDHNATYYVKGKSDKSDKWTRRDSVRMAWNASKYKGFGR